MFIEPFDPRGVLRSLVGQLPRHLADDGAARPEQPDEGVSKELLVGAGETPVDLVKKIVQACR
jgi:hypothetical protein